jgi:hypothetical protein
MLLDRRHPRQKMVDLFGESRVEVLLFGVK